MDIAYRGIPLREAREAVERQCYVNSEERKFSNSIEIKAVFGPGVYLVNNYIVAAEYAYCHAESTNDLGCVVRQTVHMKNPMKLDQEFGEKEIRRKAFDWKFAEKKVEIPIAGKSFYELSHWAGTIIREFLVSHHYDGIEYKISEELIYYVCYQPSDQIKQMCIDFIYHIDDVRKHTFTELRKIYNENITPSA
ncbi:hypothetical protein [Aneurinibacillus terranovensis]|uniref:hypothetical protein n=1 Tax=Aneurinibacillus terranovensis TaxID=278991 RepID=UPI0006846679